MYNRLAAYLIKHSGRPQPRQKVAEALRHATAIRDLQRPVNARQHEFWQGVVNVLKTAHFRMPEY